MSWLSKLLGIDTGRNPNSNYTPKTKPPRQSPFYQYKIVCRGKNKYVVCRVEWGIINGNYPKPIIDKNTQIAGTVNEYSIVFSENPENVLIMTLNGAKDFIDDMIHNDHFKKIHEEYKHIADEEDRVYASETPDIIYPKPPKTLAGNI